MSKLEDLDLVLDIEDLIETDHSSLELAVVKMISRWSINT